MSCLKYALMYLDSAEGRMQKAQRMRAVNGRRRVGTAWASVGREHALVEQLGSLLAMLFGELLTQRGEPGDIHEADRRLEILLLRLLRWFRMLLLRISQYHLRRRVARKDLPR